jgi:hypothetical protein
LSCRETCGSYAEGADPAGLLGQSRIDLATQLRVEEGLTQKEAYYVVDQMLANAPQSIESKE